MPESPNINLIAVENGSPPDLARALEQEFTGLSFIAEKHGKGEEHQAAVIGGQRVIEVFPESCHRERNPSQVDLNSGISGSLPALEQATLISGQLEEARRFYEAIGIKFTTENQPSGDLQADLYGVQFEICEHPHSELHQFPLRRLGFEVASLTSVIASLRGVLDKVPEPKDTPFGRQIVVDDPDGNRVALVEKKSIHIGRLSGEDSCDIAIVGIGPTGGAVACGLGVTGKHEIRAFDATNELKCGSRASGLQPRILPLMERIGVLDALVQRSTSLKGSCIYLDGEKINAVSFWNPKHKSFGIGINQFDLEGILQERIQQLPVKVHTGKTLVDLQRRQGMFQLSFEDQLTGEIQTTSSRMVIGCDGGRSTVRKGANIDFPGTTYPGGGFAADCIIECPLDHDYMHFSVIKGSRLFFVPLPGENMFKISGSVPKALQDASPEKILQSQLRHHDICDFSLVSVGDMFRYRTHARVADSFHQEGLALCGDAAHLFPPRSGQGVTTGIEDALAIVDAVQAMESLSSKEPLEEYSHQRRQNALSKIDMIENGKRPYGYRQLQKGFDVEAENERILKYEL